MANTLLNLVNWFKGSTGSAEKRSTLSSPSEWMLVGDDNARTVTASTFIKISTVFSCIRILSETIAALPKGHYRKDGEYRFPKPGIIQDLISVTPDGQMSSFDMWHAALVDLFRKGNGYILILRNKLGIPFKLKHLPEHEVRVTKDKDGVIWYKHKDAKNGAYAVEDVIHLKWFTLDGLIGVSPITYHRSTFNAAMQQHQFSKESLGAHGTGYIKFPEWIDLNDKETKKSVSDSYKSMVGRGGGLPVLFGGAEYVRNKLAPGDAEYVASRKFTKGDIREIYRIPPAMAQDYEHSKFSNSENQDISFVKHTLMPLVVMIEKQMDMKLLSRKDRVNGEYFKLNVKGLLRGDIKTQQEFYRTLRNIGALNANEIRGMEDMNPFSGGEKYLVQSQYAELDKLDEYHKNKTKNTSKTQNSEDDDDSE